ncbi:MAG: S1 RNA-binding domain-containing protein [Lachnospiraceae bacterium]|nr:S1 RNA-binding domain-containing protein [Lachnospiraceae bacterium]
METMKDFEKELEESYKQLEQDDLESADTADGEIWMGLKEKMNNKEEFSVKIKEAVKGGVIAFVDEQRAFIPASQIGDTYIEKLEEMVGKHINVRITEVDPEKKRLILSGRVILQEQKEAKKKEAFAAIKVGAVYEGTVETLQPYGVFVSLSNGISGLVHISQICERRIGSPKEVVREGQKVMVKVLKIEDGKISLSMKGLNGEEASAEPEEPIENYVQAEEVTTSLGSLLAGIKLDN